MNLPVYSISSSDGQGHYNMHICIYVSAVSMIPKRFAVAVYKGTRTLENIKNNPHFVLQLLSKNQYGLVALLGKKSGKSTDKIGKLSKRNMLTYWQNFPVLNQAAAVMEMKVKEETDAGDHYLYICDVVRSKNLNASHLLTLDDLRKRKLIRI